MRRFPDGFLWGVATSSFQIEGSLDADGRGRSIWDDFPAETGETGAVACDHYRRWRDDVELIASLGVNAYRLSIAWPRILPDGRGRVEQRGVDHYSRLIDALLERGIEPVVTLYHWDLPASLDWRDRTTADAFAEYARVCFDAYGDRVDRWITINEPWVHGILGHADGVHAPGQKDLRGAVLAMHHMLVGHGLAARERPAGIAFSLFPTYPASDSEADREAAWICDGYHNRWFLDPVLKGAYPDDMLRLYEERVGALELGELDTIAAGCAFVGVNYYSRGVIRHDPDGKPFPYHPLSAREELDAELTDGGYEIAPFGLTDLLVRLKRDYGDVAVVITENGAIYYEAPHDAGRVSFLRRHVEAVHDAIERGVDVRGYCHWSLLDNFEWAMGYKPRFGLVHVDYETQARTVKDSGRELARIAKDNAL